VLSLPIAPYLHTPDLRAVAEAVQAVCAAVRPVVGTVAGAHPA